jgi:hypothetical protein
MGVDIVKFLADIGPSAKYLKKLLGRSGKIYTIQHRVFRTGHKTVQVLCVFGAHNIVDITRSVAVICNLPVRKMGIYCNPGYSVAQYLAEDLSKLLGIEVEWDTLPTNQT